MNIKFKSDGCSRCPFFIDIYKGGCKIDKQDRQIVLLNRDYYYDQPDFEPQEPECFAKPDWCPLLNGANVVVEWGEYGVEYDK